MSPFSVSLVRNPVQQDYCRAFAQVNEAKRIRGPKDAAAAALFCAVWLLCGRKLLTRAAAAG
jgi:hypothetical protein